MVYRNCALTSLARYFSQIEDPRDNRGKRHRLVDVLIMAIYGMFWQHTDFANMALEIKYHEGYFTELLGLEYGTPSHDTFSAVFSLINPQEFLECFINWLANYAETRGAHVPIDGKAIRAACDKVHKGNIPYIVNAYLSDCGLCVGQLKIDEKTNEIKGIPEILKWLDLEGALVTIDAIGCQEAIINALIAKNSDFVLTVKDNQPTLHNDIELLIATLLRERAQELESLKKYPSRKPSPIYGQFSEYQSLDMCHGRLERRKYYVFNNREFLLDSWPAVAAVGYVVRERVVCHRDESDEIIDEAPSMESMSYIMSKEMSAEEFACYVRGHWKVENSLHWVLDDYFREDRCTARIGHATENLALLRKTVFNLMKLDKNVEKMSMRAKSVYYRNNPQAIEDLIFNVLPSCHSG